MILAGTAEGVFALAADGPEHRLESRCVRDLVRLGGRLFAGTDAGLFLSDDDGAAWRFAGLGDREIWQVRGAGARTVYAATQPAALFRSDDGGDIWRELPALADDPAAADWCLPLSPPQPARARALVVDRDDPRRLWLGIEVGGIARSDDGGESWSLDRPGGNPDLHMMFAHPAAPATLYASTGYGRIHGEAARIEGNAGVFRSDDYGATWRYVWAGIEPRYSRPMCVDPRPPYGVTVASAPSAFSHAADEGGAAAMLFRSAARRGARCATLRIRPRRRTSTASRPTRTPRAASSSAPTPARSGASATAPTGRCSPRACRSSPRFCPSDTAGRA